MIITCPCGDKKFNVNASLIPKEGRELQCGFCERKWFFKKNEGSIKLENELSKNISTDNDINEDYSNIEKTDTIIEKKLEARKVEVQDINRNKKNPKIIKNSLVLIISIVALIVLLDTFKFQLNSYIPKLDLILNNLYESLKDISLFFKDLVS
tara:strand:+ start:31 stop:489 length:459 start_codon:yes stop_codon:yes gene_type:complete